VPQAAVYCAPVAQGDSSGDEVVQAGCSAESAGYSVELQAADSSPGDCSVVPELADSALAPDDCSVAPRVADWSPGDCSAVTGMADSAVVPDDSSPGDCSVVPELAGSAALRADGSAVRERLHQDAHLEPADFPAGSLVG